MNSLFFNDQTASFIILNALLQIILPDMVTEILKTPSTHTGKKNIRFLKWEFFFINGLQHVQNQERNKKRFE